MDEYLHEVTLGPTAMMTRYCGPEQLCGNWCILSEEYESASTMPPAAAMFDATIDRKQLIPVVERGGKRIALVGLFGPLIKGGWHGNAMTSSSLVAEIVKALARDPDIDAVALVVDSPGGTVAGTETLATAVRDTAKVKPVVALVDELAASAAYWVASQATAIYAASNTARVGSIGVLISVLDSHRAFEAAGLESVVISTGPLKGLGITGTELTDIQRQYIQRGVNETANLFKIAVAVGRGISYSDVDKAATGAVFFSGSALKLKLIDGVKDRSEVLEALARM